MENKSNSLNRIKRHQREKVLRFSIRKYSFGAASVAIAALMFLGARVVSADTVSGSSSPSTAGVVQPNDKGDSPVGIKDENKSEVANNSLENKEVALVENSSNTVDKSQLRTVVEELNSLLSTKLNLDDSVLSSVKERVQRAQALLDKADAVQKDINELKELLSADLATLSNAVKESSEVRESNTGTEAEKPANQSSPEVRASEESQTVSAKKDSLKLSVDQLQAAISEVPEHDTTKEVLEKANEVMVLAQGVLQNTTVSLTDVEQMNKLVKRMFNSVKNATLRLSSGSHDPRNGQRMTQGTGERAAAVSSRWTNQDNLLSYQRFRATDENGRVRNDDRQFTENKVDMTARIETIDGVKYAVYDIFFNNDGKSMVRLSRQQLYNVILPPKILDLQSSGAYKSDTIRDLHFDTYRRNNQNESGTLSQNPDKFTYESTQNFHFLNDNGQSKGNLTYFYNLGVRQSGRSYDQDMKDYFKNNKNDPFLKKAVALDGVNKSWSYGIGVRTNNPTAAVHMHFKAKLRSDVTDEAVKKAFILAIAGTYGETTNQSYVFGSGKNDNENVEPTVKQSAKYPISGREVTKKVDAPLGDLDKPVDAGFVTGNNNFPTDIRWSWPDGKPNTTTAGVFRYKVKAQYSDNTSNTTDATLKVLPNKPEIDQKSVNEKAGKTGQTVTVNVGKGVPDNSTVTLYSGNTVIGTGNTKGTTATITVSKALPSTAITAKTTVKNNGTVESEFSAPVTPTEVPDKAAPTVLINGKKLTENADDNRFIIYRGANFNPTFRVQDDKSNHVNLSITGLPNGVANVTTSGGKEFNYTIPDNTVANEAPFGESIASVVASDGRNSATYKFKYRIVDIQAKNSTTENRALGSALGDPHDHFKVAESNTVENDKYYPTGMQFKWIELNRSTITTTDVPNTTNLNELGNVTKYFATAVFPAVKNTKEIDRVNYTIYSPKQKAIPITFNVTDNVKPTVKLVGDNGSDT
ncbi:YSIRK-type signal peptide-containing protein, partial [Streptococcus mitis]